MKKVEFNIFAAIYLYLHENVQKQKLNKILYKWNENINYFSEDEIVEINFIENIQMIILTNSQESEDIFLLIKTLLSIDYHFNKYFYKNILLSKKPLNDQYNDKIIIFPKRKTIERKSGAYENLLTYFQNIYPIIIKPNLSYNIVNYYIDNKTNYINIAILPMRIDDRRNEKFIHSLKDAINNNYNILISNELDGSSSIDEDICNIAYENDSIFFIACPSHLSENINKTKIYCHENHEIIETEYIKHSAYTERGIQKEPNDSDKVEFLIFHIENVGMVGVVICKDFFSEYTSDLIKSVQVDIIMILSYTPKYEEFISKVNWVSSKKRVCLLCNSCEQVKKNRKKLKSPVLIGYYVKSETNSEYKLLETMCDFRCEDYEKCYFGLNVKMENGILRVDEMKHILGWKNEK